MKNYKILIISLLLVIFMVGAVSAADENVTDDNLEINVEGSVDSSDTIESDDIDNANDVENPLATSADENVVTDGNTGLKVIIPNEQVEVIYGEEKNFTLQFVGDNDGEPYPNASGMLTVFHADEGAMNFVPIATDGNGVANFQIDLPIGTNIIVGYNLGDYSGEMTAIISVIDPSTIDDSITANVLTKSIKMVYGDEKNVTVQFESKYFHTPYSNGEVTFFVYDNDGVLTEYKVFTDNDGYANLLIDWPIGGYGINGCNVNGTDLTFSVSVRVFDPEIKGHIHLSNHEVPDVIYLGETSYQGVQLIDTILDPISDAVIFYSVNDMTGNVTTGANGWATLTLDSLPVGVYNITFSYPEFNLTNSTTLYVLKEPIPSIFADNLTVVAGDGFEYSFKLLNKIGDSLVNAGVALSLYENGQYVKRLGYTYTDEEGIAIFDLDLEVGNYTVQITNPNTRESVFCNIIVLANSSISTPVDATFNCSSGTNHYAMSFTNINGTPLANGTVEVSIDGAYNYTLTTDENGTVDFLIPSLAGGDHIMTITNKVTGEKITTTFNYIKEASSISSAAVTTIYNGGKYVVFTLKNSKGEALIGKDVSVVLNGKTIKGVTDANGQFKVSTDGLAPKAYTATITFAGDDYFTDSTATAKITVKKATPKMTAKKATFKAKKKTKKYSIVLKDNKNKAMKKVKVTLKVGKKTYKATTNSKGKATFKITKLTKKGKYTAKVKFAGNKNYNAVTKKVKITVKK